MVHMATDVKFVIVSDRLYLNEGHRLACTKRVEIRDCNIQNFLFTTFVIETN